MSRKSAKDEALVSAQVPVQSRLAQVPSLWAKVWEQFAKWSLSASEWAVSMGALCRKRVLLPSVVYLFAFLDVSAKAARRLWFELVCAAHALHVAAGRLKANRITAASIVAVATAFAIAVSFFGLGFSLKLNGEEVGYLMDAEELNLAVSNVERKVSAALGRPYGLNPSVSLSFGIVERDQVLSTAEIESLLVSTVSEISELYVLSVDGEAVGAAYSEDVLRAVLDSFGTVPGGEVVRSTYNRNVKIEKTVAETALVKSEAELSEILSSTVQNERYYTVSRGDTWEEIAHEHGLSVAQLKELNPGKSLRRGQSLLVCEALPFLSVEKVVRVSEVQPVAYETVKVESADLYIGTQKVQTKGVQGSARITTEKTYRDGELVSSAQVSSEVIKQPVTRVVKVGTKAWPKAGRMSTAGNGIATGNLMRPVSGAIVYSDYGYRKSGFHTGIDFAISKGTPIHAADGGTVTFSGYKGDFGKLIIISHGNGLTTYYAHNAANNVRVGQKVSRGQQIGTVGSSGNSTGPHCHFEVRVNGKNVNPWRYIS